MAYGLISDNTDSNSLGMSMLAVASHVSGTQELSFARNPYSSTVTWMVIQQNDVPASEVISFPNVRYTTNADSFMVTISGGTTPCYVFLFVR